MKQIKLVAVGVALLGLAGVGCSSGRDVEVSGKVTAPSTITTGDKMVIDFIDVVGEGTEAKQSVALKSELKAPGDFKETVSLEGEHVLVRAIDDRNGDGECSAGEAWGETQAAVTDGKVEPVSIALTTAACPAKIAE